MNTGAIDLDSFAIPPEGSRDKELLEESGEASWLVTPDDARFLEYTSGIGVTNIGHAYPRVVAAVQARVA